MTEQATAGRGTENLVGNTAQRLVLWLYVTGATSRSAKAISNIRRICEQHMADNYDLRIVDMYLEPEAALAHQIIASPTLVKVSPAPVRRLIGDLSDESRTLSALGIQPQRTPDVAQ